MSEINPIQHHTIEKITEWSMARNVEAVFITWNTGETVSKDDGDGKNRQRSILPPEV
jgi:hypothetical protein